MKSVINEIGLDVSLAVLKEFAGLLREEEYKDAVGAILPHIQKGLRDFQARLEWRQKRLDPSKN